MHWGSSHGSLTRHVEKVAGCCADASSLCEGGEVGQLIASTIAIGYKGSETGFCSERMK